VMDKGNVWGCEGVITRSRNDLQGDKSGLKVRCNSVLINKRIWSKFNPTVRFLGLDFKRQKTVEVGNMKAMKFRRVSRKLEKHSNTCAQLPPMNIPKNDPPLLYFTNLAKLEFSAFKLLQNLQLS
jgi:hypothetical protein